MKRSSLLSAGALLAATAAVLLGVSLGISAAPLTGCTDYCHTAVDPGMDKRLRPLNPSQCIDCHLDEQREWDFSDHAITTRKVQAHQPATDHKVSECLGCHSTEYILAPAGHKPETWTAVSSGVTCILCHADHSRGERPGERTLMQCEQCHSGLARGYALGAYFVFNPQKEVFRGEAPAFLETQGVPNRWKSKGCADCHLVRLGPDRRSHSLKPYLPNTREFSCGQFKCHEGEGEKYTDLARSWQRETQRSLAQLRGMLEAKRGFSVTSPANQKHYQIAKFEFDLVLGDLSYGVHNIEFTRHLLAEARRHLTEIR